MKKIFRAKICVPVPLVATSVLTQNKGPGTEAHFWNPPPHPSPGAHATPPPHKAIFGPPNDQCNEGVILRYKCLGTWDPSPAAPQALQGPPPPGHRAQKVRGRVLVSGLRLPPPYAAKVPQASCCNLTAFTTQWFS